MIFAGRGAFLNLAILVAVLGFEAACASEAGRGGEPEWLFMQTATSGEYDNGTLTLDGVDFTVAFADRPRRQVVQVDNDDFARIWHEGGNSFADDPPNAALAYEVHGNAGQAVLELSSVEVEDNKATYVVAILDGAVPDAAFDRVTLVIDAIVNAQITDAVTQTNSK